MKNNLSYYRHEVGSHNHWKFKTLRRKYKWDGEGRFWALNNMIATSEGCRLDITDDDVQSMIAAEIDLDVPEFIEFIEYLIKSCRLIIREDGCLLTGITQENLSEVNEKRERQRNWKKEKSTQKNEKSTSTLPESTLKILKSRVENEQSKVKESKVKESKVKNIESKKDIDRGMPAAAPDSEQVGKGKKKNRASFIAPTHAEFQEYFLQKISDRWGEEKARREASECFDHYEANGWVQGKNKPIVDWRAAARNWIRREMSGDFGGSTPSGLKIAPPSENIPPTTPKPIPRIISESQKLDESRSFVEDLYADYLSGNLRTEFISTAAYDILKAAGRMKMGASAIEEIRRKAMEKRLTELKNSDAAADKKQAEALTQFPDNWNTDTGFFKYAKIFSLLHFFEELKLKNETKIFYEQAV